MRPRPISISYTNALLLRPIHHPHPFAPPNHHKNNLYSTTTTTTTTTEPLILTRDIPAPHCGSIRILTLNSPRSRNAISRALLTELSHQITSIRDECTTLTPISSQKTTTTIPAVPPISPSAPRALILTSSTPHAFSAGADLRERLTFTPTETRTFLSTLRSTLNTLSALPIPSIAAISSLALGGGLEMALATTFRIVTPSAKLGLPEVRLGIIPGAGGTWRLAEKVGRGRAREIIMTGRRVGGREAWGWGLAERLVETDAIASDGGEEVGEVARERVLEGAVEWAREICEGAPRAVGAVLRATGEEAGEGTEGREYEGVVGTGDRDEGLRAFREKRRPVFRGW